MKNIMEIFLNMVYPSLIALCIFAFTSAFVEGDMLEPLQLISAILSLIFGLVFIIGFIMKIIYSLKENKENN